MTTAADKTKITLSSATVHGQLPRRTCARPENTSWYALRHCPMMPLPENHTELSERELSASLSVVAAAAGLEVIQTYLSDSDTVACRDSFVIDVCLDAFRYCCRCNIFGLLVTLWYYCVHYRSRPWVMVMLH